MGRFSFGLYEAVSATGEVVLRGAELFPVRRPREWYKTEGFREEALCLAATQRSYRENVAHLNRSRRHWQGGTPVTTLQDNAQQEGARVEAFMEHQTQVLFERHAIDAQGQPSAARIAELKQCQYQDLSEARVAEGLKQICQAMPQRDFSPAQIQQVNAQAGAGVYEDPQRCTLVAIDDVEVKQQKAHRERPVPAATASAPTPGPELNDPPAPPAPVSSGLGAEPAAAATAVSSGAGAEPAPAATAVSSGAGAEPAPAATASGSKRPKVANTVAHIERASRRFTLNGSGIHQVLRFILAFLLNNALLSERIHIFTDGHRGLQNAILAFFAWHPGVWLLLDWYHLVKKFKEDLSLACRGRAIRNQHLRPLMRLLWYGLVDEALHYLDTLAADDLKDPSAITRLKKYLQRNRSAIPCYALRRQLGLRNASSPVESANNQLTSRRQKHNGMSWSAPGSRALTTLSMLVVNRIHTIWVQHNRVPFEFAPQAA